MLIKRIEKEKTIDCLYESSNILASSLDKSTHDLTITFNRGTQYIYRNVKNSDYLRFELAESQGAVLNTHIKAYPFVKGVDINTDKLINEIKTYTPKVLSDNDKLLLTNIKDIIKDCELNQEISEVNINKIIELLNNKSNKNEIN